MNQQGYFFQYVHFTFWIVNKPDRTIWMLLKQDGLKIWRPLEDLKAKLVHLSQHQQNFVLSLAKQCA